MNSNKKDRKDIIKKHKKMLEDGKKNIEKSESILQERIKSEKKSLLNLNKTKSDMSKKINLLDGVDPSKTDQISENIWDQYNEDYYRDSTFCASLGFYANSLEADQTYKYNEMISGEFSTRASSSSPSFYYIFKDTPAATEDFNIIAQQVEIDKNQQDTYDSIYREIKNLDDTLAAKFEKIYQDFLSASEGMKYTSLLDLRSLIFDQLLEEFSPESDYSKTEWHKTAVSKGLADKKKRLAQPKYFILGQTNFSSLPNPLQKIIDDKCVDVQSDFGDLAKYGKAGTADNQAEIVFTRTLGDFLEILELRKQVYTH